MVDDALKDDRVPAFAVKIITVIVLRSSDGNVTPIYCSDTLWEPPSLSEAFNNLYQVISSRPFNVLRHEDIADCKAKFMDDGTNCGFGNSEQV